MKKFLVILSLLLIFSMVFSGCSDDESDRRRGSKDSEKNTQETQPLTENVYEPTEYDCDVCGGDGDLDCNYCGGSGVLDFGAGPSICSCGDGKTTCYGCNGEGVIIVYPDVPAPTINIPDPPAPTLYNNPASCVRCKNTGTVICTSCNGAGKFYELKHSTNYGAGSTPYTVTTTCKLCMGKGLMDCPNCY